MEIEKVHIVEYFATMGHTVAVIGREYGQPRMVLAASGEWEPLGEVSSINVDVPGIRLPEGALDAIVAAHQGVTAPTPALERHLVDALEVRDRLLTLVERRK